MEIADWILKDLSHWHRDYRIVEWKDYYILLQNNDIYIKKMKIKKLYSTGMEEHILLRMEQYMKNINNNDILNFKKRLLEKF